MIRSPRTEDQSYVCSTWMRSARVAADTVNRLLDHHATKSLIACEPDDQSQITGWIVYGTMGRALVLHYLYVRDGKTKQMRGKGIARELVSEAGFDLRKPVVYTVRGPDAEALLRRYTGVHMTVDEFLT